MSHRFPRRLLALCTAMMLLLSGCGPTPAEDASSAQPEASSSQPEPPTKIGEPLEPVVVPDGSEPEEQPAVPSQSQPEAVPVDKPVTPPVAADLPDTAPWDGKPYDFSAPAPENGTVSKDYFADAAFVGDSRTDGFLIYSGIGRGKNLTSNGLSIFKLSSKKALKLNGKEYTLLEALALEQYKKVYLSLGVNELGVYNDQGFYDSYCAAIDAIQKVQPNAVVYVQGLIPLNEKRAAEVIGRDYLKNDHLRVYNDLMRKAAQSRGAVFLDLYSAFADASGSLPYDASHDGVHLGADYCKQWLEYLRTHTVNHHAYLGETQAPAPAEPTVPAEPALPVEPDAPAEPTAPAGLVSPTEPVLPETNPVPAPAQI